MRATVFRNLDSTQTLLGLAFPGEVLILLGAFYPAMFLLPASWAVAELVVTYVLLRVVGHRRPPLFLQHWAAYQARQAQSGGRFAAGARARQVPRFPAGPYLVREVGHGRRAVTR